MLAFLTVLVDLSLWLIIACWSKVSFECFCSVAPCKGYCLGTLFNNFFFVAYPEASCFEATFVLATYHVREVNTQHTVCWNANFSLYTNSKAGMDFIPYSYICMVNNFSFYSMKSACFPLDVADQQFVNTEDSAGGWLILRILLVSHFRLVSFLFSKPSV